MHNTWKPESDERNAGDDSELIAIYKASSNGFGCIARSRVLADGADGHRAVNPIKKRRVSSPASRHPN
jgi:hypothetical protein